MMPLLRWLGGLLVRTSDSRLAVEGSPPGHDTAWLFISETGDKQFIFICFVTTSAMKIMFLPVPFIFLLYAVVTCEIKLFQNYFRLHRRLSEIILFQPMDTRLKLFQNYEYFPTYLSALAMGSSHNRALYKCPITLL